MSQCSAPDCSEPSLRAWTRWCTPEEVQAFKDSGDLPEHITEADTMVYGCEDHLLVPRELMSKCHESGCRPPVCHCTF